MRYLPARCEACGALSLAAEASCSYGDTSCPECKAAASVLPGCSYAADDLALFQELHAITEHVELSSAEAGELVLMLESLYGANDDQATLGIQLPLDGENSANRRIQLPLDGENSANCWIQLPRNSSSEPFGGSQLRREAVSDTTAGSRLPAPPAAGRRVDSTPRRCRKTRSKGSRLPQLTKS